MRRTARALIIPALLFGGGLLLMSSCAHQQMAFRVIKSYPAPPARAQQTVYRLIPQFTTRAHARTRALQLGLSQNKLGPIQQREYGFHVSDGHWDYTLDTERHLECLLDRDVMTGKTGRSPVIPDPEQCRTLALHFLGTKNLVLGTKDEELRYERTNEINRGFVSLEDKDQTTSKPRVILREIVFCKWIGGVPVIGGPGSHVSVFIGDRGAVVGFMSNWMPVLATSQRLEVVTPPKAFGLLKRYLTDSNNKLSNQPQLQLRKVTVQNCHYALQAYPDKEGRLLLLPVYAFRGTVLDKSDQSLAFSYSVFAPKNYAQVLDRLNISPPTPVRQPPVINQTPIRPQSPSRR